MLVIAEAGIMGKNRMNGEAMPRYGFTRIGKICMNGGATASSGFAMTSHSMAFRKKSFRKKWQTAK